MSELRDLKAATDALLGMVHAAGRSTMAAGSDVQDRAQYAAALGMDGVTALLETSYESLVEAAGHLSAAYGALERVGPTFATAAKEAGIQGVAVQLGSAVADFDRAAGVIGAGTSAVDRALSYVREAEVGALMYGLNALVDDLAHAARMVADARARTEVQQSRALAFGTGGRFTGTAARAGPTPKLFDPSLHLGPLGASFKPGVYEPNAGFVPKERLIGEHLAGQFGAAVHHRPADNSRHKYKNPDAIVRYTPDDTGRFTEFKTLDSATSSAVKRDIIRAGSQVGYHGGGDAVLDGRRVGLDEATARRGYSRAAGQARTYGQSMPRWVRIILSDGRTIDLGDDTP